MTRTTDARELRHPGHAEAARRVHHAPGVAYTLNSPHPVFVDEVHLLPPRNHDPRRWVLRFARRPSTARPWAWEFQVTLSCVPRPVALDEGTRNAIGAAGPGPV